MSDVTTYRVEGMTCEGCARAVTAAIRKQVPDAFIEVDVLTGFVRVGREADEAAVRRAVERAGFTWGGISESR
ncbi:MAG: heavy-metal-associated domain-containing protein [Rhodospirillales bacterium]|nr:heavy-metal-associated domain-containing protein [Rhodospirillales bacterium]